MRTGTRTRPPTVAPVPGIPIGHVRILWLYRQDTGAPYDWNLEAELVGLATRTDRASRGETRPDTVLPRQRMRTHGTE